MFNKNKICVLSLTCLSVFLGVNTSFAGDVIVNPVKASNLPINVTTNSAAANPNAQGNTLVSPSKPQAVEANAQNNAVAQPQANKDVVAVPGNAVVPVTTQPAPATQPSNTEKNDFDFDLKMKAKNTSATTDVANNNDAKDKIIEGEELPKDIQYKTNPVDNLGNNILSQIDDDLFTQMSEIEKQMTLLTLELRREKIKNEIEAQKAIRQKNADDLEQQKSAQKMQEYEKKKKIEAEVLSAKQNLLEREQLLEVLRQRKLLNAYMNQMLLNQQEWIKEKEALYTHIALLEQEKKDLIKSFRQRIDKVLEASAKNIQIAEAAKSNFERIVKNLKARNEQLRKRVEADAKIIKSAKNMYVQSQSIEELKDKNAAMLGVSEPVSTSTGVTNVVIPADLEEEEEEKEAPEKISSKYALLGITGRTGAMSIEVIGVDGQPITLKIGSVLPTGHIVKEIGSDYAKFSRNGEDDYLYIGRSIDGYIPVLEEVTTTNKKKK